MLQIKVAHPLVIDYKEMGILYPRDGRVASGTADTPFLASHMDWDRLFPGKVLHVSRRGCNFGGPGRGHSQLSLATRETLSSLEKVLPNFAFQGVQSLAVFRQAILCPP